MSDFHNIYFDSFIHEDELDELLSKRFIDLQVDCEYRGEHPFHSSLNIPEICIYTHSTDNYRENGIELTISFNSATWNNPYTITQFSEAYIKALKKENIIGTTALDEWTIYAFTKVLNKTNILEKAFKELIFLIEKIYKEVKVNLEKKHSSQAFSRIFNFPSEYKNICSQYLMWFGEFLKNLGIEADVYTEPRNGQTALIVSPKENKELLTKIEELFYRYIDLPYMDYIPYNAENMNVHQKYKMDSLLDEIGDYQHKLKKAMRHQKLLEVENDGLLEDKIKLKTTVKELEKDKLLLKSCLKDPKKNEFFSCFNKSFSLVGSVDNKNDLTLGFGIELKPKGIIKEIFKKKNESEASENSTTEHEEK